MKRVLIIKTSLRKGGNSDTLADYFAKGALQAGNEVEIVSLAEKNISFCKGCLTCQKTQKCIIKDDAAEIIGKIGSSDVIVWATPVYYYSCSGLMKTMIDRTNPLYTTDYRFRNVYLLCSAAEDESFTPEGTVKALSGWVDCYPKSSLAGVVFAGGVNLKGEINGRKELEDAFQMGLKIE